MAKNLKVSAGIKVEKSKFAVLKIENDDADEESEVNEVDFKLAINGEKIAASKINNQQTTKKSKKAGESTTASNKVKQFQETDWETWKKKDEEVFFNQFFKC